MASTAEGCSEPKKITFAEALKRQIPGYFFLLPGFLFIFVFMIYPLLHSFVLSFTNYNFAYDDAPVFCGFDNYRKMFSDTYFLDAFRNTVFFSALFFPLMMILSLIVAPHAGKGSPRHALLPLRHLSSRGPFPFRSPASSFSGS